MNKPNPFFIVWSNRNYRNLLVIMLLAGLAVSSAGPLVTLFLTKELGADPSVVGLFYLTSIAGLFINLYTGKLSDRRSTRLPFIKYSAIWLSIGWIIISLSQQSWMVFAVGAVFLSFLGTLNAQTFGVVRDVIAAEKETRDATITSIIRTAYSFGWMIGPAIGPLIASLIGYRLAFWAAVLFFIAILIPLSRLRITERSQLEKVKIENNKKEKRKVNGPLLLFGFICTLMLTGEAARIAYLPLLAVDHLGMSVFQFGLLMSVAPLTELFIMPLSGMLADKFGLNKLLFAGILIGSFGFFLFASSEAIWQVVLGQMMNACFISVIFGLSVTYAQQLIPGQAGLASSVFFSAQSASFIIGSLVGSYGVHAIGLPFMFYIPSVICLFSCVLFVINDRLKQQVQPYATEKGTG
ncbi:sugar efflux transporter [Domibacillus iocasae]|uniref:Major facilitator superfamily (MFS) profile domain-containing protein n=1 Tax=Domibacillus iocasae TaxID=1714016 RepID=A0A1E7DSL3_9BACI|nr:sugar efflux transporter [Domibacillus iocasae]OES46005.1 hypothetical protein BA724_16705 [Domibacillus iocasae]